MTKVLSILPRRRFDDAGATIPPELEVHFESVLREDEIIEACRGMDFLLVPAPFPPITARILHNIPSVRMIQSAGVGYDKVDLETAARLNIPVANSPGHNTTTVAEYTIALLIALQRHMLVCDREVKAGNYKPIREHFFRGRLGEVRGTRLGIVGLGAIGRKVAELAVTLGAHVSYYDPRRISTAKEKKMRLTFKPFKELVATSDALSLHVPLTEETRFLIGPEEIGLMRAGAFLINTSRGEVVDAWALAEALEKGALGGAAIDTVFPEPPPPEHPLLNLSPAARDKLLITPHIAGITKAAFNRMLTAALENILRVCLGEAPRNVVNGVARARDPR